MTSFQSFMILKTNKRGATKSYSEVCWACSVSGLCVPGSSFSKPQFSDPPRPGGTSPHHLCGQALHSRSHRGPAAAAPRPLPLLFRGGAGAAGASPRGHGGAVAAAATSGECPEAGRAGPGPAFLLRPCPRRRSRGGSEGCPLPWRPGTTSRARVGGGRAFTGCLGRCGRASPPRGCRRWRRARGRGRGCGGEEGRGCGSGGGGGFPAPRRRPAGFGSPSQCDGVETFLRAVIRFETP